MRSLLRTPLGYFSMTVNSESLKPTANRRAVALISFVLCTSVAATVASGQQGIPFGDVPATTDFTEQAIAARGQQHARDLTYSDWTKLCFKGVQGAETKMVCRTTISGKLDTGQIGLKVDLIERQDAAAARLQIFVPLGSFLQPGIKVMVDEGISMHLPYTICLANGCIAATVADPSFVRALESGRMLSLEGVNADVVTVITSLPLDNFGKAHQGAAAQIFEQKLEGKWEQPADEGSAK
jgi:invasion protein IalB